MRLITVGGSTKQELLDRLTQQAVSLNDYGRTLFADDAFATSSEGREVRVAVVSLPEIGLAGGATFGEIVGRAGELGLEMCELEVAPHLRLQYLDQPEGPYLTVASPKLRPDDSFPNGLYLRRLHDGLWLRGYNAGPENIYQPDFSDFAFVYPSSTNS